MKLEASTQHRKQPREEAATKEWKEIFASHTLDIGLTSRMYTQFKKLNINPVNT